MSGHLVKRPARRRLDVEEEEPAIRAWGRRAQRPRPRSPRRARPPRRRPRTGFFSPRLVL